MIQRRKLKNGEVRYDVRLRRPDGTHYVKTFRTKKEAETYKATEMADRARGTWIDPKAGKISFADWSAEWLKTWTMTWRIRTADKHQMAIRVHWVPTFGSQEVGSITPRQVQAAVDELAGRYQPSSVRSYYGTLRTCLLYAVERDLSAGHHAEQSSSRRSRSTRNGSSSPPSFTPWPTPWGRSGAASSTSVVSWACASARSPPSESQISTPRVVSSRSRGRSPSSTES